VAVLLGTVLLSLPVASAERDDPASIGVAAFTATSAVTVTGLAIVDTAGQWSVFGEVVILALIQLGGIGIMTLASIVLLLLSRRIGLRHRLNAQVESGALTLSDVGRIARGVLILSVVVELAASSILALRFWITYDDALPTALWSGVFHGVSAFNNAGFSLYSDSLTGFVHDPVVILTVGAALILGGLGVPVLAELRVDRWRWDRWTLHTKLTLSATAVLIVAGTLLVLLLEWSNPASMGGHTIPQKVLSGFFQGVTPRTAGFNSLDYAGMRETTWLVTSVLMLGFVILSEIRGERDVNLFNRRSPTVAERQALAIALVSVGVAASATLLLMTDSGFSLSRCLFEVTSALGTTGLTTGITAQLPDSSKVLVVVLMFIGRIGPLTLGAALAVQGRDRRYRYPEERPLIG
jgi:trk system potassium uptake protein